MPIFRTGSRIAYHYRKNTARNESYNSTANPEAPDTDSSYTKEAPAIDAEETTAFTKTFSEACILYGLAVSCYFLIRNVCSISNKECQYIVCKTTA